jgi:hypothetical protein
MNAVMRLALNCYALLVSLYPRPFRREFGAEMCAVFAAAAAAANPHGRVALMALLWRELRDCPGLLWAEYRHAWQEWRRGALRRICARPAAAGPPTDRRRLNVSNASQHSVWNLKDQRHAILASLPPLLFGVGMAMMLVLVGPRPLAVPQWQLMLGVVPGALAALAIFGGGLVAAVRRVPDWGYAWVGAAVMVFVLSVQVIGEELAESGITLPPVAEAIAGVAVIVGGLLALGIAARRGWAQAGMVSIGLASMMGLSVCYSASSGPLHRHDVAVLAAPLGLICAVLCYAYVRRSGLVRLGAILGVWCLNALGIWLASRAWQDWQLAHDRPSFAVPTLAFLTAALLAGPLLGGLGEIARRLPRRA